jgi:hypothetical protein
MALKRRFSSFWQMVHFVMRFLGVTGAMAALVGWFIYGIVGDEYIGLIVVYSGLGAMGLALVFEVRGIVGLASSRRGFASVNVVFQVALMLALVVGANVFSFKYHWRFDMTGEKLFTLPDSVREQLLSLRGDTEIVVLQQYVSFGQNAENKQDKYDFAAQRKIVEKVKDLADQFADLGPRFRVHILDIQDDNYEDKLKAIEKNISKPLAEAVKRAPENSIFFYSKDNQRIQRLSFSDIYQLDKQGSIDNKNLVLKYQGVEPFARKIFNIEEKRPRLALAIVHPVLGFNNKKWPDVTMSGAKKVLDTYGFDTTDIMVRKLAGRGRLTEDPAALTYEESRYEQIEDELPVTETNIKTLTKFRDEKADEYRFWRDSSLAELNKKYIYVIFPNGREGVTLRTEIEALRKAGIPHKTIDVDEDDRRNNTIPYQRILHRLDEEEKRKQALVDEKKTLHVEEIAEKQRLQDVEAKMKRTLANVDLLIIPRITLINATDEEANISNRAHKLDVAHLNAIKAFLKEGKPILVLLGPTNEPSEGARPPDEAPDQLESMLGEIGFKLPKQTVLYDIEIGEYTQRNFAGFGRNIQEVDVPGLDFDDQARSVELSKKKETLVPHPLRTSINVFSRTVGAKEGKEVRIRHPRPVYFVKTSISSEGAVAVIGGLALAGPVGPLQAAALWHTQARAKHNENAVILVTPKEICWNEENPFIVNDKAPEFTPTKDTDPKKGTVDEVRRGPFPIGVAVETTLPDSWLDKGAKSPKARIAVIGSGGAFVGTSLAPLKEKMFLDTVNWLMGRDDLLARDVGAWEYPRVPIKRESIEFDLWQYGARVGLPLAFIYFGIVVWLVRRMR